MRDMMETFAKYAKDQFGYEISLKPSSTPDTFESLFGTCFIEQGNDDNFFSEMERISYRNTVTRVNSIEKIYIEKIDLQQDVVLAA